MDVAGCRTAEVNGSFDGLEVAITSDTGAGASSALVALTGNTDGDDLTDSRVEGESFASGRGSSCCLESNRARAFFRKSSPSAALELASRRL
jgi:hypothetical protein